MRRKGQSQLTATNGQTQSRRRGRERWARVMQHTGIPEWQTELKVSHQNLTSRGMKVKQFWLSIAWSADWITSSVCRNSSVTIPYPCTLPSSLPSTWRPYGYWLSPNGHNNQIIESSPICHHPSPWPIVCWPRWNCLGRSQRWNTQNCEGRDNSKSWDSMSTYLQMKSYSKWKQSPWNWARTLGTPLPPHSLTQSSLLQCWVDYSFHHVAWRQNQQPQGWGEASGQRDYGSTMFAAANAHAAELPSAACPTTTPSCLLLATAVQPPIFGPRYCGLG